MDHGAVSQRHKSAENGAVIRPGVDDGPLLDGRPFTDNDRSIISPENHSMADVGIPADLHVAYDKG
jgi:hypothetical protein